MREMRCKELWIDIGGDYTDSRHFENHDPDPRVRDGEMRDLAEGRARYRREPDEAMISIMEELVSKGDFRFQFDNNMETDYLRFSVEKDFAERVIREQGLREEGGAFVYSAENGKQYLIEYINDVTSPMRGNFMMRTYSCYLKVKCLTPDPSLNLWDFPVDDTYGEESYDEKDFPYLDI